MNVPSVLVEHGSLKVWWRGTCNVSVPMEKFKNQIEKFQSACVENECKSSCGKYRRKVKNTDKDKGNSKTSEYIPIKLPQSRCRQ